MWTFPFTPSGSCSLAAQLQPRSGESERHRVGGKRVQEGRHVRPGDQRHDHEQSELVKEYMFTLQHVREGAKRERQQ